MRALLAERGWLRVTPSDQPEDLTASWISCAASWLGPQAADRESLVRLVGLVFAYDAHLVLAAPEAHAALLRKEARDVLRALANRILAVDTVDSDRFKEIVTSLKEEFGHRGRSLFHPVRLALAGRVGEGELDRVIVLIDGAAAAPGLAPVKTIRARVLEFCAALD